MIKRKPDTLKATLFMSREIIIKAERQKNRIDLRIMARKRL